MLRRGESQGPSRPLAEAVAHATPMAAWARYSADAVWRAAATLDTLRQRAENMQAHEAAGMARPAARRKPPITSGVMSGHVGFVHTFLVMAESVFIVRVPEAEPYVGHLRERFDPSAKLGVPAHITVLYPFKPPEALTPDDVSRLRELFACVEPFDFTLREICRLPETIYLAPQPATLFLELTSAIWRAFPAYPPYAGHRDVVSHLTIALADPGRQDEIQNELSVRLPPAPGIRAVCTEVTLIENATGQWKPMHVFALRPPTPPSA